MRRKTCRPQEVALIVILALGCTFTESRAVAGGEQAQKIKASASEIATKLIGTWKLEAAPNPGSPSGIGTRLRLFTGSHWCVIQPDPETGVIVFQLGGRYTVEGHTMKETTDFAGDLTKSLIGHPRTFTIQVDGDTYKQLDPNGKFTEIWKRAK